jgi:hypothetical protein
MSGNIAQNEETRCEFSLAQNFQTLQMSPIRFEISPTVQPNMVCGKKCIATARRDTLLEASHPFSQHCPACAIINGGIRVSIQSH